MATSATPEINKVALYALMLQSATSNELRDFCFRLDVTYESVVGPNDVVQIAIQKTINYFEARGRLPELIEQGKREFPNVDWQQVYNAGAGSLPAQGRDIAASDVATISEAVFVTRARTPGPLRIFLCHAREDKTAVRELHLKLKAEGFDPWLDAERLRFGQKWRAEIPKAIQNSDVILVCLSQQSAKRDGYIKQEIGFALDIADKQPDDATFIIPVRLEECPYPGRLGEWHAADVFEADDLERLLRDLKALADRFEPTPVIKPIPVAEPVQKKIETPTVIVAPPKPALNPLLIELPKLNFRLELVRIPAGPFTMGGDGKYDGKPIHEVTLPEYWMGKYPVTNVQYASFAKAVQRKFDLPEGKDSHPVVDVDWKDALAFCEWLSKESQRKIVLPSEAEWEKAARGADGRIYPWGNEAPDQTRCNFNMNVKDTTPVGKYSPKGDSPYGCVDMAGNVWEWTRSLYRDYPYDPKDGRESLDVVGVRVVRGGAWGSDVDLVRAAYRNWNFIRNDHLGFRVGCVSALLP